MKLGRIILSAIIAAGCMLGAAGCNGAPKSSVGNIEELNIVDGDKIAEITIEGYGTMKAKLFPDLAPKGVENFIMLAEQGYYDGLKIHRVMSDGFIQGGSLNGDGTGGKALVDASGIFDIETSPKARHIYGALSYSNENGSNATQFFIVNSKTPQDLSQYDAEKIKTASAAHAELKAAETEGSVIYNEHAFLEKYFTNLSTMISEADEATIAKYKEVGGIAMLDGGYTVFGQVYEGLDVLDAISGVETDTNAMGEKSKPTTDIVISKVEIITYKAPTTAEATGEADSPKDDKESAAESNNSSDSKDSSTESNSTTDALDTVETSEKAE